MTISTPQVDDLQGDTFLSVGDGLLMNSVSDGRLLFGVGGEPQGVKWRRSKPKETSQEQGKSLHVATEKRSVEKSDGTSVTYLFKTCQRHITERKYYNDDPDVLLYGHGSPEGTAEYKMSTYDQGFTAYILAVRDLHLHDKKCLALVDTLKIYMHLVGQSAFPGDRKRGRATALIK